jgi:Holliday junction resolvase
MVNSRSKGSKNERKIAHILKEWSGYEFTRTPSSGGLRWQKTNNTAGDIVCTDEFHRFPFCIEGKSYKEINFEHLIYLPKNNILEFWAQATADAERAKKLPLLFMRYNGLPKDFYFVVMRYDHFLRMRKVLNLNYNYFRYNKSFVILHSSVLLTSKYKKIYKIAKAIITETWLKK